MREARALVGTFATLYFIQGACEPTYGLLSQPLRAALLEAGATPGECARYMAVLGLPWLLKPLYGPIIDSLHRRSWMIFGSLLSSAGFARLAFTPLPARWDLITLLLLPSFAIAFSDVATDAMMVEHGQRLRITGLLQSAQWTASYCATIALGWLGGYFAADARFAFGVAAALCALGLIAVLAQFRGSASTPRTEFRLRAALTPRVLSAAGFLFLLGFNPFHGMDYAHVRLDLGLSDAHYGQTVSLSALFSVASCLLYGWLSQRVPLPKLAHAALAGSVLATFALLFVQGVLSNFVVNGLTAFAWTFTLLMQLDLAARLCPARYAGTVFALLMGVSNGADSLAAFVGGSLHDWLAPEWGARAAYALLVSIGATSTIVAWWLLSATSALDQDAAPGLEIA